MKVYIATSLRNHKKHNELRDLLKEDGIELTSVKNSTQERLSEVAELEKQGVLNADVVVVLLPGGRGTHAELGMALASNKPVVVWEPELYQLELGPNTCAFYWNNNVHRLPGKSLNEVVEKVKSFDFYSRLEKVRSGLKNL